MQARNSPQQVTERAARAREAAAGYAANSVGGLVRRPSRSMRTVSDTVVEVRNTLRRVKDASLGAVSKVAVAIRVRRSRTRARTSWSCSVIILEAWVSLRPRTLGGRRIDLLFILELRPSGPVAVDLGSLGIPRLEASTRIVIRTGRPSPTQTW